MKSQVFAIIALVVVAIVIVDATGTQQQFCAPDAFDWLINNCPTKRHVAVNGLRFRRSTLRLRHLYQNIARDLHTDCCGQPGCTEETVIQNYC
ncbi:hypothetical protein TrispH2_004497 [Trichoplax sp. H2]|nr:hypothetical protein TrispH2_004497 [Trichoplax sp. H2]|eukprot:RDD43298.1 hypothetical protein TrispH2_004497 [Trichoplax sp. H2]